MSFAPSPHPLAAYPIARPRRLRASPWIRRLVSEHTLTAKDLIWPIFLIPGSNRREAVATMPGVERLSIDLAVKAAEEAAQLGIPAIALFPATPPELKTERGDEALNPGNLVNQACRAIRAAQIPIGLMVDVALDPYTTHGHDGIPKNGHIDNDETVEALVQQALLSADAGADILSPSDMMDGRVGAIRTALEEKGHTNVTILAYAAKYASGFYGPYRDAIGSGKALAGSTLYPSDKTTYQMDSANSDEAIREVAMDLAEGADMVMVKPGMPYLDIIRRVSETFAVPTIAYQVSGEYSMLVAASERGFLDLDRVMMESLLCFKRAGADAIVTYFALTVAKKLR
jgi:porphobilinogen synthase